MYVDMYYLTSKMSSNQSGLVGISVIRVVKAALGTTKIVNLYHSGVRFWCANFSDEGLIHFCATDRELTQPPDLTKVCDLNDYDYPA